MAEPSIHTPLPVDGLGLDFRDLDASSRQVALYAALRRLLTNQETQMARDEAFRQLFSTVSTEHQETLTAARGAIDRISQQVTALQDKVNQLDAGSVSDDAFAEFTADVDTLKASADEAQAAFDAIGVPASAPAPSDGSGTTDGSTSGATG